MNILFPGDIWLILFFQGLGEWLAPIMKFFTWLGYPQAYMILIAVIYWSFDRKLGLRLAIFLPLVASLNSILKQAFHAPRPYWLDPGIKAIHVSNGFGMPSGHAQASIVWIFAGAILKRKWFWLTAVIIVFMIGLSRIYLGVHFPSQVFFGWLTGVFVLFVFIRAEAKVLAWFLNLRFSIQLLLIGGISSLILLFGGVFVFFLRNWEMPALWIRNTSVYFFGGNETIRFSVGMDAIAGNAGAFMGTAIGAILSHRKGGFDTHGSLWKLIIRSIAGLVICGALYGILVLTAPEQTKQVLYCTWRFSGFLGISFSAIFLVPLFLMRMQLLSKFKGS